ncbi:FxsB family cyclophane-forming radical SAM/SPASM peptide maturase [Micromonospora sp. NPDC050417]|uniref:FxsB family cyclophane-forming radical SAM/SPASM peptide maturase n=1 Tax=Micromonospora sp. NPDC050417 TaxID=3364280 RepID=UPI003789A4D9
MTTVPAASARVPENSRAGSADGQTHPIPFRQILLKIHSRCNLACSYCYVYEHADQSWRQQPRTMAPDTIDAVAARIAEHARRHRLPALRVILHGGEPLLAGADVITHAATAIRSAVPADTDVDLRLTTNGTLIDDTFIALFHQHRISVGVSIDGGRVAQDRHRRLPNGRGSYRQVSQGLHRLAQPAHRDVYAGVLCTIDLDNDPIEVYQELLRFDPPEMELLLPLGNWDTPPPGRSTNPDQTPYADWLIPVFDRWFSAPRRETRVRLFESIIRLLLGGTSRTEAVGLAPVDLLTVETDGSIEQTDALKTSGPGMAATGLDVRHHPFDDALEHPGVRARHGGLGALSTTCQRCPVVTTCGGGLYAHRFRNDTGFVNPSVYCPDLYRLVSHIRNRLLDELPHQFRTAPGLVRSAVR